MAINTIEVTLKLLGYNYDVDFVSGIKNLNIRYSVDGKEYSSLVEVEDGD